MNAIALLLFAACAMGACASQEFAGTGAKAKLSPRSSGSGTGSPSEAPGEQLEIPTGERRKIDDLIRGGDRGDGGPSRGVSSNPSVASFDPETGEIVGKTPGKATVIVTTPDGREIPIDVTVTPGDKPGDGKPGAEGGIGEDGSGGLGGLGGADADDEGRPGTDRNDAEGGGNDGRGDGTNGGKNGGKGGDIGIVDDESSVFSECKLNLDYNPSQVDCAIAVGGDHIWRGVPGWDREVRALRDQNASFISPLAAAVVGGRPACPLVPGAEKLVYVTYVKSPKAGKFRAEAVMDDLGRMYVWERSDPAKEIYATKDYYAADAASFDLEAKGYAIVIEARDVGQVATGAAFSLAGPDGGVVKRSAPDGSWCIFRVPAATDVRSFLPDAAGCRPCFGANP